MNFSNLINKFSTSRMEYQSKSGSVLNSFVVPFFIDRLDLRKLDHSVALCGSRGSGKSTYIQYYSHHTRFDKQLNKIKDNEFECIILYWKPEILYCQGLKENWLGTKAEIFFLTHASLSILEEISIMLENIGHHFEDLKSSMEAKRNFWNAVSYIVKKEIKSLLDLNNWISNYQYEISTRLNPINTEGMVSFNPKSMLIYLIKSLKLDYPKFKYTTFKIFIDEFELLDTYQQKIINTYIKESNKTLSWNVAFKLNSKPSTETISNQWLQEPDDYVTKNLDEYLENTFDTFAAEIFLLTLQNAGLKNNLNEITPNFLGNRDNISTRLTNKYKVNLFDIINSILPTPKINELVDIAFSSPSVKNKFNHISKDLQFKEEAFEKISVNSNIALFILGTHRQKSFCKTEIENFILGKLDNDKISKLNTKIVTFEFNTLLSLNLQNKSINIPVYAGFDRFITMSSPNIRHFKQLCTNALRESQDLDSETDFINIDDVRAISFVGMNNGAIRTSEALVNEVSSYPPHGKKLTNLVNRVGELFRISQKTLIQTEPERTAFTFHNDGSDIELEKFLNSALSWRVLVKDETRRIKDDMQITNFEYRLNPLYSPKFGISYRKKRGIKFDLKTFKDLYECSPDEFERIRSRYLDRWSENSSLQEDLL